MSSISASDRARQTDELRSQREESQAQEVETAKRNRAEKQRMQERHNSELARLREDYERQIDTIRSKSKESLTARDQENREQMDKIKNLYFEQLKRKTEENDQNRKVQRETYDIEMDRLQKANEQQKSSLTRNFENSLKERNSTFAEFQENANEKVRTAIEANEEKWKTRNQKDSQILQKDRDDKVMSLTKNLNDTRAYYQNELKDQKRKTLNSQDRRDDHWQDLIKNQERMNSDLISGRDMMLQNERRAMVEKNTEAMDAKLKAMDEAREELQDRVEARQDSEVRSLKSELDRSKTDRTVDMIANRRLRDLERKNLVEAQYARMQALDKERSQMLDAMNADKQGKINDVLERSDKVIEQTNRGNRMKQNLMALQSKEDRAQLEFEMKSRLDHADRRAEDRVKRVLTATTEESKIAQKYHQENLSQLKNSYNDNLANQREAQLDTLQKVRLRAEERIQEVANKSAKKLEDTVTNYEAKIEKMEEDHKAEKARLVQMYEQRMTQREKALKSEQESIVMRYEAKLASVDETRQKELDRIEKRNQEKLADMSSRLKYLNNKKA